MRDLFRFIKWIITTTLEGLAAVALFLIFMSVFCFCLEWVVENGRELEKVLENPETYNLWDAAKYFGLLILGCWLVFPFLYGTEAPLDTPPVRVKIQK